MTKKCWLVELYIKTGIGGEEVRGNLVVGVGKNDTDDAMQTLKKKGKLKLENFVGLYKENPEDLFTIYNRNRFTIKCGEPWLEDVFFADFKEINEDAHKGISEFIKKLGLNVEKEGTYNFSI